MTVPMSAPLFVVLVLAVLAGGAAAMELSRSRRGREPIRATVALAVLLLSGDPAIEASVALISTAAQSAGHAAVASNRTQPLPIIPDFTRRGLSR